MLRNALLWSCCMLPFNNLVRDHDTHKLKLGSIYCVRAPFQRRDP